MKKYFTLGLSILLPFLITVTILKVALNTITAPFHDRIFIMLTESQLLEKNVFFIDLAFLTDIASILISLVILIGLIILLGYLANIVLVNQFLKRIDFIIRQIPGISSLYKTFQDAVGKIFKSDEKKYMKVVLVPYPHHTNLSIGLLTQSIEEKNPLPKGLISVFVPSVPNPTGGYVLQVKKSDLIYIDMPIPDALKCVISGGIMIPPFSIVDLHGKKKRKL